MTLQLKHNMRALLESTRLETGTKCLLGFALEQDRYDHQRLHCLYASKDGTNKTCVIGYE